MNDNSEGMVPIKLLFNNPNIINLFILPKNVGIVPVNELPPTVITYKLVNLAYEDGILPLILLRANAMTVTLANLLISGGSVPLILFWYKDNCVICERSPSVEGNGPDKKLFDNPKKVNFAKSPNSVGILP